MPTKASNQDLERTKLELEVRALSRSWWRQPAYLAILIPGILSLLAVCVGLFSGYFSSLQERIRSEQALLKVQEIEIGQRRDSLSAEISRLTLRSGLVIDSLSQSIQLAEQRIATLNDSTIGMDSVMRVARASLFSVSRRNQQLIQDRLRTTKDLEQVGLQNDSLRSSLNSALEQFDACLRDRQADREELLMEETRRNGGLVERVVYYSLDYPMGDGDFLSGVAPLLYTPVDSLRKFNPSLIAERLSSGRISRVKLPNGQSVIAAPFPR